MLLLSRYFATLYNARTKYLLFTFFFSGNPKLLCVESKNCFHVKSFFFRTVRSNLSNWNRLLIYWIKTKTSFGVNLLLTAMAPLLFVHRKLTNLAYIFVAFFKSLLCIFLFLFFVFGCSCWSAYLLAFRRARFNLSLWFGFCQTQVHFTFSSSST